MELKIVEEVKPPPAFEDTPTNRDVIENPERFNRKELRAVAAGLGIPKAWSMNKIPLVQAIKAWKKEIGWNPPAEK